MSHKHLSAEDRTIIATLIQEGRTYSYIAGRIGVHRSTISREIQRNGTQPRPKPIPPPPRPQILDIDCRPVRGSGLAQAKYHAAAVYEQQLQAVRQHNRFYVAKEARRQARHRRTVANRQRTRLVHGSGSWLERYLRDQLIKEQWSPEQIAGELKRNYGITIYHQTIYDYICLAADKKLMQQHLRRGGKPYRKHGTNARIKARSQALPSIHERSGIIEDRARVGDLEGDTIVGSDKKDRILTHVDRASGEGMLDLVLGYSAELVSDTTIRRFKHSPVAVNSSTYDRGVEFAAYERTSRRTGIQVYFADAYHSWERGSNENFNGLLRQYFPKRTDFKTIAPKDLAVVEKKLNNRPRKRYNYRTPIQQRQYLQTRQELARVAIRDII